MTNQLVLATHFVLLSLAFFHPLAGAMYTHFAEVQDPFWLRIALSVSCIGLSLLIMTAVRVRRHHWLISRTVFMTFAAHVVYLTWLNNLEPVYFSTIPLIIISAPIFFTRYKSLIPVLAILIIAVLLVGFDKKDNAQVLFFFMLSGVSLPISFFNLFLFQRIIKKLQFSDYVLNNMDALVLAANNKGEVTFASKNINKILGFSRQDVLGRGWWNLRLKRKVTDAELESFLKQMVQFADQAEGYDSAVPTKLGSEKWFHWKIVSLGNQIKVGVGQDISKRKAMEKELNKLSLIARETDNLVVLLNPNKLIEWVNAGFTKITHLLPEAVSQAMLTQVFRGEDEMIHQLNDTIDTVLNTKSTHYAELEFKRPDASLFWINVIFTPILQEGEVSNIICIGRDSTQTKETEAQLKVYHDRLEALHKLDYKLFSAETLDELFDELADNVAGMNLPFHRVSIAIYEFDETLVKVISRNPKEESEKTEIVEFPLLDFERTISILRSAEYVLNDLSLLTDKQLTHTQRYLKQSKGILSYISLPIRYKGVLVGSLNFGADTVAVFKDDVIEYLMELASDVALAVYQFQLKESVRLKNLRLEERNRDIEDSIHYAQRIQSAVFPSSSDLEEFFDESFVFFQPKDNLSGDFYWLEETADAIWIAVADCTGHGVPGAFVSLVGINILNQAVHEKKLDSPDEILAYLNSKIIRTFNNANGDGVHDALDIGICRVDKTHNKVSYSGVLNDLYLVRDGELHTFKASRFPIGIKPERVYMDFELHEITLKDTDCFYLVTDGIVDQFGGEANKKYGRRNLKKLLKEVCGYPLSEQHRILYNTFELWKREQEQTDDVLCIGFRPKKGS